jgi:hypothetical protein
MYLEYVIDVFPSLALYCMYTNPLRDCCDESHIILDMA